MTPEPPRPHIVLHVLLSLFLVLTMVGISSLSTGNLQANLSGRISKAVDIAVEYDGPLSLSVEMSTLGSKALLSFSHDSQMPVALSVPQYWQRLEVRGAPLSAVTSEAPTFGFVRWQLPPQSTVSFLARQIPPNMLLHNPNGSPVKVELTLVNLETESVMRDVILVKDAPAQLL